MNFLAQIYPITPKLLPNIRVLLAAIPIPIDPHKYGLNII